MYNCWESVQWQCRLKSCVHLFLQGSSSSVTVHPLCPSKYVCFVGWCLTSQQQTRVYQGRICLTSQQQTSVSQGRICLTSQQQTSVSQGRICLTSQQQTSVSQGQICLTSQQQPSVSQGLICLTSQQQTSVSQGRICSDNFTCCHTEIEVADQTFYLTQSQYTDTGPTSPSADPITPGAWQGSHWSANFKVTGMTRPRKHPGARGIQSRNLPLPRRTP